MKALSLIVKVATMVSVAISVFAEVKEPDYKGGTIRVRMESWPKSLNYYDTNSSYTGFIWRLVGVSLTKNSRKDWSSVPYLAKSWKISDDKKTYTYYLNKNAKWQDGKPITAEDVVFTFDLIFDAKKAPFAESSRSYIGKPESVKAIDSHTVEFRVKKKHFDNLSKLGGVWIYPKHIYSKGNFAKKYDKVTYSGGPYNFDKKGFKFRKEITLRRQKNHWAYEYEYFRKMYNFDKIVVKHIKDPTVAFETFKRRELDVYYFRLDSIQFWDDQKGFPYTDKRLGKVVAEQYNPSTWAGTALNMRSGPTADLNFRKALQYLLNRELITSKVLKGHYIPVSGPFMRGGKYSSNSPVTPFDTKEAIKYLKKAGFKKTGDDGILYREINENGKKIKQKAEITIMYASERHAQWMTIYKEDAKKVGVNIIPRYIDWSAGIKLVDEFKFEGFVITWSGDPVPAPEQLFHGRSAMNKGTSNIPGLNDPEINKRIDAGPEEFDDQKRYKLYKEIEKRIIANQPYIFRWMNAKHKAIYWNDRIDTTETPWEKYGGHDLRVPYWFHWRAAKK